MEAVASSATATVTLPTDEEILITREFDAPKHLVYKAWTTPELVKRWWPGRRGEMTSAEIDLRVGGTWRYVMIAHGEFEVAFHGEFREIVPNERIVTTEVYEMPGADAPPDADVPLNIITFTEVDGQSLAWISRVSPPVARETRRPWAVRGARLNASADNPLDGKWRGPTLRAGPLVSRPVSRILSWTAIHLCGRPGPWRVTCKRSCLALHRVGFAQPPRHRDAGALLPHHFTLACAELSSGSAIGGVFLWHFPAGFPGSVSPTTLPCGVRTFLDGLSVPPRLPSLHWRG
jgi:uncharacterized protein YndB with AHSA1/START domain